MAGTAAENYCFDYISDEPAFSFGSVGAADLLCDLLCDRRLVGVG